MASKFNPIIRKTRLVAGDIPPQTMLQIGTDLRNSIRSRIHLGVDVYDQYAPPLSPKYEMRKERRGKSGIRDWDKTGRTLRAMQVLSVGPNKAVIGFDDLTPRGYKQAAPSTIAEANNKISHQFGASPSDLKETEASLLKHTQPIKIVTTAA